MDFGPGPWDKGIHIPAIPQELGDPELGRDILLNGGYMSCGIPARLLTSPLIGDLVGAALGPALGGEPIEGRTGPNEDMAHAMTVFTAADGAEVANVNCLMCHAGHFDGALQLGLGNAESDFTGGFGAGGGGGEAASGGLPAELTALLGMTAEETVHLNKMLTRSQVMGDITAMRTVGQNPAEAMAISLMAHHEEDLSWSDTPVVPWEFTDPEGNVMEPLAFPSDVPPWWRARKKHALFYNAMARGDHSGSMALASSICVDDEEEAARINEMFKHMHAYVLTLQPPIYPFAIDLELADAGAPIYEARCAGCHGTYGLHPEDDTFPNLVFALEDIGTDPVIAQGGVVYAPQMVESYNKTYYGKQTPFIVDDPVVGYMAPPLDGVWATGPFFHNGSVPTIELVLDSEARPEFWRRVDMDSSNFDQESLGWPYEALAEGQDEALPDTTIYDGRRFGQGVGGHTYGDALSDTERRAVLEYLKTL